MCMANSMALLKHEIWELIIDGMVLHTCCLVGPAGDSCRQSLEPGARLLTIFQAGSHFETLTFYNHYLDREPYTTLTQADHQPYPEEWLEVQQNPAG